MTNPKTKVMMKLSQAIDILKKAGIDDPKGESRRLFAEIGGIEYSRLVIGDPEIESEKLAEAIIKRIERFPLQYIIGKTDFYREEYELTEDVLIPRPDTEILVDYAVRNLPEGSRFIDLCTGSGCVAISTLKNTNSTTAVAVDISEGALRVAQRNAAKNGVLDRISIKPLNVLSSVEDGKFFAVLSNPPYVTKSAYENLEPELYREPRLALVGENDGLIFYERIIPDYKDKIEDNGFIAFEIGFDQGDALSRLAALNSMKCEIIKDLSGNDRVAVLKK